MQRNDIEIMAPVGSPESLRAAIHAGANAVYFGIQGLNMRSRAQPSISLLMTCLPLRQNVRPPEFAPI